jgi:Na+-driven multidrug efflux pump
MLPFVARRFGERDLASVARALREAHVAGALYAALAAPILFAAAPALAGALSSTAHTREFATLAIRLVPIGCLASIPFFLCRPTFEGLGRGRPGLLMAILRYLVLSAPSCWLGVRLAHAIGVAGLYGVILGLFTASGISSVVFLAWTRRTLRTERRLAETSPARLPAVEL